MAYGIKYRFRLESIHGVLYTVNLLKDGYSGSVTLRHLGASPVIRMQENGQFRATSCNLKLECSSDGEFAELYTSDPNEFQVQVFRGGTISAGGTLVWTGFIATEIYSEPDIAPPYDVDVTATDGLGILKEHTFEASGPLTLRQHLRALLGKTGLGLAVNAACMIKESSGTATGFMDSELIDLDHMAGENCYDVLGKLLDTLNATITQTHGEWLIIRETDAVMSSGGNLSVIRSVRNTSTASTSTTMAVGASVGQMGAAQMWPVGYLTRGVVPAKKDITIRAPWFSKNAAPSVADDGWTSGTNCTFNTNRYRLGSAAVAGRVSMTTNASIFTYSLKLVVRASRYPTQVYGTVIPGSFTVKIAWYSSADSTWHYWYEDDGWNTTSPGSSNRIAVDRTNEGNDVSYCEVHEITIPAADDSGSGILSVAIDGVSVDIYDISLEYNLGKGYEDHLVIDNNARGTGETVEIMGGRRTASNPVDIWFLSGVFYTSNTTTPTFSDYVNSGKDFITLTALSYAKAVAGRRIETRGVLDFPDTMTYAPIMIYHHSMWSVMSKYDWNLKEEEINFTAVSLPTAVLDVDSETITGIPEDA